MAKLKEGLLATLDAAESGAALNISDLEGVRCHVSGTFTADVDIEISYDLGVTWAVFQQLTAAGLSNEIPPCGRLRATASAYTSGTATVNYGGRDPNRKA